MGLETGVQYLDDFNSSWPLGSDPKSEGDDQIRLVKVGVLGNITGDGAVTRLKVATLNGFLAFDNEARLVAGSDGQLAQFSISEADETTARASIGYKSADDLEIRNWLLAGRVDVIGEGAGGAQPLASFTPDGAGQINYAGEARLASTSIGARALGTRMLVENDQNSASDFMAWNAIGGLRLKVESNTATLRLYHTAAESPAETQLAFESVVGDRTLLAYAGNTKYTTTAEGFKLWGAAANNAVMSFADEIGAVTAELGYIASSNYGLRNQVVSSRNTMYATDAGGNLRLQYDWNPDAPAVLYGQGQTAAVRLLGVPSKNSHGEVYDGSAAVRSIGFNEMPGQLYSSSHTLGTADAGKLLHTSTSGTVFSLSNVFTGATIQVANRSSFTMTIAQNGLTLRWFEGSSQPTGDRQLASGGVCTLFQVGTNEWWMWGNGIT